MKEPTQGEMMVAYILATIILTVVSSWVVKDARKRGFSQVSALCWGIGVFLMLGIVLPAYLLTCWNKTPNESQPVKVETKPCPYCGYENRSGVNYCEKCQSQLRSSNEIHAK